MENGSPLTASGVLTATIARKRREIAKLKQEIGRLQRQLSDVRRFGESHAKIPRVSSANRLLVEHVILDDLRRSVPPESPTEQLWALCQGVGVKSRSTFRSHLRRMKEKGLITSPETGRWTLAPGVSRERRVSPEIRKILEQIRK